MRSVSFCRFGYFFRRALFLFCPSRLLTPDLNFAQAIIIPSIERRASKSGLETQATRDEPVRFRSFANPTPQGLTPFRRHTIVKVPTASHSSMGQSISFPHKLQQPGRKAERIRFHDHDHQSGSFLRRSSMGGRLQSYGVILYQAPSPTTSTEVQGPTSSENLAASVPSPVMNDMISVGGKRTKQRWPIKVKTSSTITTMTATTMVTMTTERSFAAVTPTRPTRTPRRLGPYSTPVAAVQPSPLPAVKSASSFSNVIVSVASNSRVANDRIGLSLTASAFNNSPSSALVSSGGSGLRTATPVRPRLPNLRLGELEQIFTAIVTSDDSSARVKLALSV